MELLDMYNCLLCKRDINDEISFEFSFYHGNGLNRIWDEKDIDSNQSIYWSKNIDTFCPECASILSDCNIHIVGKNFKYNMQNIFENIINSKTEKNPNCHICGEAISENYYSILFDKLFVTEKGLEIQESHFIAAYCLSCFDKNHYIKSGLIGDCIYGLKINNKHKFETVLSSRFE